MALLLNTKVICNAMTTTTTTTTTTRTTTTTPTMSSVSSPMLTVSPCVSITNLTSVDGVNTLGTPVTDELLEATIGRIFETQSAAIERWLREKATPDVVKKLHGITEELKSPTGDGGGTSSSVYTPCYAKRPSVTSELFNQWLSTGSPKVRCRKMITFF